MFSWHPLKSTDASKFSRGFKLLEADTFDDSWRMEYLERAITKHCWSPIIIKGGHRLEKNFLGSHICALDFDAPYTPLDCAIEEFKDFSHIIATTKSHQKPKNGVVCDRYRVVLWWERLITDLAEYKFNLSKQIDNYYSDKACKDGARFFFPCVDIVSSNGNGKLVPVDALPLVKHHAVSGVPLKAYSKVKSTRSLMNVKPAQTHRNDAVYGLVKDLIAANLDPRACLDVIKIRANGLPDEEINTVIYHLTK
jgi:hypothetical protein